MLKKVNPEGAALEWVRRTLAKAVQEAANQGLEQECQFILGKMKLAPELAQLEEELRKALFQ